MIGGSIYLNTTNNITILANDFLLCNTTHLKLVSVTNGLIYLNYFYDATYGDAVDDGTNDYDNGTVGNYWCNYTGESNDGDYYGDTPYVNGDGVTDNYPIVLTMNNNSVAGLADIIMDFLPVLITVMIVIMMLNFISKMFKNIGKKQ
jgi:nitrous oxidase accessory protein NosD